MRRAVLLVRAVMLRLAAIGEPRRSLFTAQELCRVVHLLGFTHVEETSPQAINARFFAGRSDMLRLGSSGALVEALV
jgi:hypothetical protein